MSDKPFFSSRKKFIVGAGMGLAAGASFEQIAQAAPPSNGSTLTSKQALAELMAGNARFAAGTPKCLPSTPRRAELVYGQQPFATLLGCADSRVPAEIIFDHEPGDIFAVRVAGNFVDNGGLGSIEYAVAVLKSKLVMVLGHSLCGAVTAAVSNVRDGETVPGEMMTFVNAIVPSARASKDRPGDWIHNAIEQNVRDQVTHLTERSQILAEAEKSGAIEIVGAIYELHTGEVRLLA